ncbi:1-phosphofructokinase [Anaerotalea alkaliphila]|uniref:Tagatose-6-phosphate kinase n=1 Tax=Anaerotalea alkaliphila TaxID=2662126 RepID=A0A7X5HVE7_9FIRM|nr:1-phosphofructokinase [Anaerotalea alkaliphila]NDL67356.1 1-phosphofructokinase [Anaerotalea alkaliphila]
MITTVTLNPAIDKTVLLDTFEVGSVNRVKSVREDMGGKGINVAKILQSLGEDVAAIGFMGEKNDTHVKKLLELARLDTEFVTVDALTRTNTKIVELGKGITTDVNEAGFAVSADKVAAIQAMVADYAKKSDYMVFSGSVPPGAPKDIYKVLAGEARKTSKVVLDAEGELLLLGLQESPYIIKPNIHELETALGKELPGDKEVVQACRELMETYGVTYVLVSMGGDGSLLVARDRVLKAMPVKVEVKSTVGAGDSMLAGFVYGMIRYDEDLEKALAYGAACGTLAVGKEGTETLSREEIEKMLERIAIVRL